jgi:hypothetical protein
LLEAELGGEPLLGLDTPAHFAKQQDERAQRDRQHDADCDQRGQQPQRADAPATRLFERGSACGENLALVGFGHGAQRPVDQRHEPLEFRTQRKTHVLEVPGGPENLQFVLVARRQREVHGAQVSYKQVRFAVRDAIESRHESGGDDEPGFPRPEVAQPTTGGESLGHDNAPRGDLGKPLTTGSPSRPTITSGKLS